MKREILITSVKNSTAVVDISHFTSQGTFNERKLISRIYIPSHNKVVEGI